MSTFGSILDWKFQRQLEVYSGLRKSVRCSAAEMEKHLFLATPVLAMRAGIYIRTAQAEVNS
jgi:hypothetical protein